MMKLKHIPLFYSYDACDDLSLYLERMAKKGWRFRAFRAGLEFERSEPRSEHYNVQVFLKNTEMDTAPEPDTEEFAAYCEAAGWEFVDSSRRFVVFRRISDEAVPIVTPGERLSSVFSAELRYRLTRLATFALLLASFSFQAASRPETWLFGHPTLFMLIFMALAVLVSLVRIPLLLLWRSKKSRELDLTGEVSCRGGLLGSPVWGTIRLIPLFILLALYASSRPHPAFWIAFFAMLLLLFAIGWLRPSRGENWAIQIGGSLAIIFLVFFIGIAVAFSADGSGRSRGASNLADAPAAPGDLLGINEEPSDGEYYHSTSLLGSLIVIDAEYSDASGTIQLYRTKFPAVNDLIYRYLSKRISRAAGDAQPAAPEWGAPESRSLGNSLYRFYILKYQDAVLYVRLYGAVDTSAIPSFKEKLGL